MDNAVSATPTQSWRTVNNPRGIAKLLILNIFNNPGNFKNPVKTTIIENISRNM